MFAGIQGADDHVSLLAKYVVVSCQWTIHLAGRFE